MPDPIEPIELDSASATIDAEEDRRPKIEQPPPVRLVAIDDCMIWAAAGLERQLDEFYEGMLNFERLQSEPGEGVHELIYRAENFRLRIEVLERPIEREDLRPLMVVVQSLDDLARRLTEQEIEFSRERGLTPGADTLLLSDPAGNPVTVAEYRIAI